MALEKWMYIFTTLLLIEQLQSQENDYCQTKINCQECIQAKNCGWCSDPGLTVELHRCSNPSKAAAFCKNDFYNEGNSFTTVLDKEISANKDNVVQIKPQKYNVNLRIDQPYQINMQYTQAADYPVDLYYLMDVSQSMKDDKEKLSELGNKLANEMRQITTDFRLGFGSFVDKPVVPYGHMEQKTAPVPHGFINHMSLSDETTKFAENVKKTKISSSIDLPEGGFDALMQAIVCRKEIGWRQQSRKLIILATDAGFHYALDGKLAGIVMPNDGRCHLEKGKYTHSLLQDYPSISQINLMAKRNSINIIFAVTKNVSGIYRNLVKRVESSYVVELGDKSANIVTLIKDQYNKISSSVELKDNATNGVKITYSSNCLKDGSEVDTNKCDDLKKDSTVKFSINIVATLCPKDPAEWNQVIRIYPVGVDESLILDLKLLCDCPCNLENLDKNSTKCHNHGSLKCGVCECFDTFLGAKCECSSKNANTQEELLGKCRPNNETVECSDKGHCDCGVCTCDTSNPDEILSGKYCECDSNSCERSKKNGLICSGPDHGSCDCGECRCKDGWTGDACDCYSRNDTCILNSDDGICSGHGQCECGECKCEITSEYRYSGKYCEKCPRCIDRCAEFRDCVECQIFKTGPLAAKEVCASNCSQFQTIAADDISNVYTKDESSFCQFYDAKECLYKFVYKEDPEVGSVIVYAEKKPVCKAEISNRDIIIMSISTIVIAGVVTLLIWKLITTIHDKKEYAKFEKEISNWAPMPNPLYREAQATIQNPVCDVE